MFNDFVCLLGAGYAAAVGALKRQVGSTCDRAWVHDVMMGSRQSSEGGVKSA